jgi:hypothetical protein
VNRKAPPDITLEEFQRSEHRPCASGLLFDPPKPTAKSFLMNWIAASIFAVVTAGSVIVAISTIVTLCFTAIPSRQT